jgi:hypothetical protein
LAERGRPLLRTLQQATLTRDADAEVEIIPYEDIWLLIMRILTQGTPG